ncbi:MAG: BON domain-containing protein [Methylacidiphilales bacterium]|nr:BON domain-containing protein [Candidatus Methylacidiphilales bacterium]
MPKPSLLLHPSLESTTSIGETAPVRHSLFDTKDAFIERIAPLGVAAIYFGSFTLSPQDAPLSRQALFKLSFLYRHFLQPGGLRIVVNRQTAVLSGTVAARPIVTMAEILATQIEGITDVRDETKSRQVEGTTPPAPGQRDKEEVQEAVQFLFATDQTLRSGVQVVFSEGFLTLQGEVSSIAQKNWAEQLAEAAGAEIQSRLKVTDATTFSASHPVEHTLLDDESQEALVLFRLRLVRDTEHLPVRVKANRGIVTLQGKVRTEALRQRVENLSRSTLGLRELRSTLSISA